MDLKTRQAIVRELSKQYQKVTKKEKGEILDKLVTLASYHKKQAIRVLCHPPAKTRKTIKRKRKSRYTEIFSKLKELWIISNYATGKRLVAAIPFYLDALVRHKELVISSKERRLLLAISPATVDRLLIHERRKITLKARSRTKPGTLLKSQIPIRTFADWDNAQPGFLEIDLVHHCGDSPSGEYIHTLDTVDVATGWNECAAFMGRSRKHTIGGTERIKERLPFPLLGVDFDTGGEFVNWHFVWYCQREEITYTRARENKKNDQAYIEQQNYSVVRRFVGYARLDKWEQLEILNRLYQRLSDYQNFFQPVMRLKEKERDGARVTRKYDRPKTPYERVLEHEEIDLSIKKKLRERFLRLNPKKLLREITALGRKLSR